MKTENLSNILDMTSLWSYKAKYGRRSSNSHQTKEERMDTPYQMA